MGEEKNYLNGLDELVLIAVVRLHDNAYGMTIRLAVEEATDRAISIGAVYTALERLERKGFVRFYQGEPTPERGGRAKRFVQITSIGVQALQGAQRAREVLSGPRPARGVA